MLCLRMAQFIQLSKAVWPYAYTAAPRCTFLSSCSYIYTHPAVLQGGPRTNPIRGVPSSTRPAPLAPADRSRRQSRCPSCCRHPAGRRRRQCRKSRTSRNGGGLATTTTTAAAAAVAARGRVGTAVRSVMELLPVQNMLPLEKSQTGTLRPPPPFHSPPVLLTKMPAVSLLFAVAASWYGNIQSVFGPKYRKMKGKPMLPETYDVEEVVNRQAEQRAMANC